MSMTAFFAFASTRRRMCTGPLGPHIDEIIAQFQGQDYPTYSIRCKIRVLADFSRWLAKHRLGADAVDADRVQRFLVHRKQTARCTLGDTAALRQIVDLLLRKHVTAPSARSSALNERERVGRDFCEHLLQSQGLMPSTPACYLRYVSRFLRERFGDGSVRLDQLVCKDISPDSFGDTPTI